MNRILPALFFMCSLHAALSCSPNLLAGRGKGLNNDERQRIVQTARKYLGVQYKYGGITPDGFDCSGYVMYVYNKTGLSMPRTADKQYTSGIRIPLKSAKAGDLVFFDTAGGRRISHVGIYLGEDTFIHAPSSGKSVSYASIDNPYWEKRYIGAVSYVK